MSDLLILPDFPGMDVAYKRTPLFTTNVQNTPSGREVAVSYESYPRYEWALKFNALRNYLTVAEAKQLQSLFMLLKGRGDYFLFADPEQNYANGTIGTGNGTNTQFRLLYGHSEPASGLAFAEPVQNPYNYTIKADGVILAEAGTGTPAVPALGQVAGGTKAARTYYVRIAYVTAAGGVSNSSPEASLAVAVNSLLTVNSPAAATGATSYNVYVGTAANGETLAATVAIGTNYTEPTTALAPGAAYPTTDGSTFTVAASGLITFAMGVKASAIISWSGNFRYRCRLLNDKLPMERIVKDIWKSDFSFRSVKV